MGKRVAVIGAGAMGLAAAYDALKQGHDVTVYERDHVAGGMAAHFDFAGVSIERFYHFICKADGPTFELMSELGIADKMRWRATTMGYFTDDEVQKWGDPISLLTFKNLPLLDKIRYGLFAFTSTKRSDWRRLDKLKAHEWIQAWVGKRAYDKLWRQLFEQKFFEFTDDISAAWIWTRLKRVGTSRRSLFQEELGYIEGGSETLIRALEKAIGELGGKICLGSGVKEITSASGRVTGVETDMGHQLADHVICTVPTPFVSRLVPSLPDSTKAQYDAIPNIGVVCVLFRLRKSLTPHFWVNIVDPRIEAPGLIEFSNLRPLPDTVVYVPYYMPQSHPKFEKSDAFFTEEAFRYLKFVNPSLIQNDVIATHVGRLRHAQPVCKPGFLKTLPGVVTPIAGLQIADTCYYYPEDRGISESVRFGKLMARRIS